MSGKLVTANNGSAVRDALGQHRVFLVCMLLMASTLLVFWRVHDYGFIDFDDDGYVSENEHVKAGLTREGIIWAFTTRHRTNWHPLTWLSHMLDCELFGVRPGWHHLTNLALHIANVLLLFGILRQMTGALWKSAFVAAAFALHPLRVESVVWISERKDVLSALFWMLTMGAYVRYVRRLTAGWYLLALLAFALGLMAKPMLVTLPFVLLLLDYWPLERLQFSGGVRGINQQGGEVANTHSQRKVLCSLIWEKAPFFGLAAISSVVTFLVGAVARVDVYPRGFPMSIRIINVLVSYPIYIGKMVWPARLAVHYPHLGDKLSIWDGVIGALLLLAASGLVIWLGRSRKYLLVGWLWFLGSLVPVIGLVQVGVQAMADRYTYMPLVGLFIAIAWGVPDLLGKWEYRKVALSVSAVGVLSILSVCTWVQVGYWRDSITLFQHTLGVTTNNLKIHLKLGVVLQRQGKVEEAMKCWREALRIDPNAMRAGNGIDAVIGGRSKSDRGYLGGSEALRSKMGNIVPQDNLGSMLVRQGRIDEAIKHYREILEKEPRQVDARYQLALLLRRQGNLDEAIREYREVLQLDPNHVAARRGLEAAKKKAKSSQIR